MSRRTEYNRRRFLAQIEAIARTIPLGRTGVPDDIAAAVVYLASPAADWITGEHLLVSGGRTHRAYQYGPPPDTD